MSKQSCWNIQLSIKKNTHKTNILHQSTQKKTTTQSNDDKVPSSQTAICYTSSGDCVHNKNGGIIIPKYKSLSAAAWTSYRACHYHHLHHRHHCHHHFHDHHYHIHIKIMIIIFVIIIFMIIIIILISMIIIINVLLNLLIATTHGIMPHTRHLTWWPHPEWEWRGSWWGREQWQCAASDPLRRWPLALPARCCSCQGSQWWRCERWPAWLPQSPWH